MSFLGEIRRRKIFQVAAVYAVVAWLLIQIVATVEEPLKLPGWFDTMVIVLLAVGFPITLIMSWGFNLTAEGFVREGGNDAAVATRPRRGIEYVLIGLIIVALSWLVYRVEFSAPETVAVAPAPTESVAEDVTAEASTDALPNSIAVLPFENLSLDPEDAFFAAGIHESTLNQLAKISDLAVIAKTSVIQYKDNPLPIPEIAEALNVETVMEGSVRYADGRVLITAQLIDGPTGRHLWSDEYNRELVDVFAVQLEVAEQIAKAMQVRLLPDERTRIESRPTESVEAYQHFLHALSLPHWTSYPEFWDPHRQSLERAIAADPGFAEAYARLSYEYNVRGETKKALEYAEKAIELDPTAARAYRTLGDLDADYYERQTDSREALKRAAELSPNEPENLSYYAYRLADDGENYEEAIRLARRAVGIDPNNSGNHWRLGFIFMRAGDLKAAYRHARKALALDPSYDFLTNLATIQYLDGDYTAALANLDRAAEIMSSRAVFRVDYTAYLYGLLGKPEKAAELVSSFEEVYGDAERAAGRTLGWGLLGTRSKERALRDWTRSVNGYIDEGQPVSPGRISRFRDNWLNDPMLEEPEFLELRYRLGYEG